ncbi:MAG TPA: ABC transporter ATP-binding protein [Candidatus Limnocylindrales bacterium]|nr:ABC transporter ATP-binding protein [Candidatus Limnocylindrales bacterium]
MNEVINVRNLSKEFCSKNAKVAAVKDVSMQISEGEVIMILGPSGSGKTTLLSMIGLILTPTSGKIYLDKREISGLPDKELASIRKKQIGFVFQGFNLLKSLTVQENVEVALNLNGIRGREAREKAKEFLTEVGLAERLSFYPSDLSGGEKQRVSIARAIANDPKMILADEPTGNLDSKTGQKIGGLLRDLAKNHRKTVVIVTHDNRIINFADRIISIEDGTIRSESNVEAVA